MCIGSSTKIGLNAPYVPLSGRTSLSLDGVFVFLPGDHVIQR